MRLGRKLVGLLLLAGLIGGCMGGDVSEGQANDRAKEMREASQRPDQQGTQE